MTIRSVETAADNAPVNVNGMIAAYDASLKDDTTPDMNNNYNNSSGAPDRARPSSTFSSVTSRQSAQSQPEGAMMTINGTGGTEGMKEQQAQLQQQQFQQPNAGFSSNSTPRRRKKQ